MLTVVICDEHIISDCKEKYNMYIKPLLKSKDVAFCAWNTEADSLDKALPTLKSLINRQDEWQALIINDSFTWEEEHTYRLNPFDYVGAEHLPSELSSVDEVLSFRERKKASCEKAMSNPLMRLSAWLCGSQMKNKPQTDYLEDLSDVADAEYFADLKERSLSALEVEIDRYRAYKYELLSKCFLPDGELFNYPKSVVAVAERSKNSEQEIFETVWKEHTEFDYSKFYQDNLYPDRLRYILYDMPYKNGVRSEKAYFSFIVLILLLAGTPYPGEALRANRVYNIKLEMDPQKVGELFRQYNSKLVASLIRIDNISKSLDKRLEQPIDYKTVREELETDVVIPVRTNSEFNTEELFAQYGGIGLSGDCPTQEDVFWDSQYHDILIKFTRFLREPRRAVKSAVQNSFHRNSVIEDERALRMNEFQTEDIEINLLDEEQKMVETVTTRLFDTANCMKKLENADKELRNTIGQRMSKKKTLFVGLFAVTAYLIGFLPLIFGNINTSESVLFSIAMTLIVLGLFSLVGLVYLFVLRHRLIKLFKSFNAQMHGILADIQHGLNKFSEYLSHACNVMRKYSLLNYMKVGKKQKYNTLELHKNDIEKCMLQTNELFAEIVPANYRTVTDAEPYNYDFTVAQHYDYDMPYSGLPNKVEFMQTGNIVNIPVDYVEAITLTREELYD
ncbi:MAG: hypothetical protein J1F23_03975 [Oscillospiraceae bacterium]|nr:hypothetical protein [Oscillospiraceae bacterium]